MACDGYEHGTRLEYKSSREGVAIFDEGGQRLRKPWRDFAGAVGIVDSVDHREHSVAVRYPGFSVSGSAHAFKLSEDTSKSNLAWILKNTRISPERLAKTSDTDIRVLKRLMQGTVEDIETKSRVGYALIELARAQYRLIEVFPHDRELENPRSYSAGA